MIIDLGLDPAQVSRILGRAHITITLDTYTHLFEDARHAQDIRTRMAASPFAGLLEPTTAGPGAGGLKLRLARSGRRRGFDTKAPAFGVGATW